eukprot:TRINITY_DN2322_c0_g1_i1.p1 TRINITY_DN2322_c0_g1~~TRINITY_DN2322_c0_g1_i1.p1  ORF type:complete len:106 (+),score=28.53 TRINITY_DN2322_c0_g1_i1:453-770(+)
MVFSITDRNTFSELRTIAEQVWKVKDSTKIPFVVIGNKCDLESERSITKKEGEDLAKEWNCEYFETSAKDDINIEASFRYLIKEMQKNRPTVDKKKKSHSKCIVS